MPTLTNILLFTLSAAIMALPPGPNMIYLILASAMIFNFINQNQRWAQFQKWLMGLTFSGLAIKLILTKRPVS